MSWNKSQVTSAIKIPAFVSILLIMIHLLNMATGMQLGVFGVYPRDMNGLPGIFTSPFIHGGLDHLFSNIVPLFVMMFTILLFYPKVAVRSMILIYILTGLSVWLMARSVFHIGASGVVYGLISFVFILHFSSKAAVVPSICYPYFRNGLSP